MATKLFEDFLENVESYRSVEQIWKSTVRDVAASLHQEGEWQRWIPRHYANGTPFELDGNPIYDGRSHRLNRAFRIIQHAPIGNDLELAAWIKNYEEEYEDLPRSELIINLSLSEESMEAAKELLRQWMIPATTPDAMERYIAESVPQRSD